MVIIYYVDNYDNLIKELIRTVRYEVNGSWVEALQGDLKDTVVGDVILRL